MSFHESHDPESNFAHFVVIFVHYLFQIHFHLHFFLFGISIWLPPQRFLSSFFLSSFFLSVHVDKKHQNPCTRFLRAVAQGYARQGSVHVTFLRGQQGGWLHDLNGGICYMACIAIYHGICLFLCNAMLERIMIDCLVSTSGSSSPCTLP